MKQQLKRSLVAMMVVMATILSFISCSDMYEQSEYIKGDRVKVIPGDTIIVTDTVYVDKIVEIETDKTKNFVCYNFTIDGNIEGHTSNHVEVSEFSYNFVMESVKEVFFTEEQESASFSVTEVATFDDQSMAILQVSNGKEQKNLSVMVPGSHSVIINSKEVFPCEPFKLTAEVNEKPNQTIDEKEYEVAVVTYTFLNGYGEAVKSSEVKLYSPVKVVEPEEPVNERTVNLSYEVIDGELVVTGLVDNSIDPDTTIVTKVPLALSLAAEEKKVVNGTTFDFSAEGNPTDSLKTVIKNLTEKKDSLTVTYNEYEEVYSHSVTASGNTVTVKQTAKYYNGFVATLYGETLEINLPVEVKTADFKKVSENETASEKSQLYNINYTASQSSLSASATQEVEIVIARSSFEGETVIYANRTVTFDKLQSPKVYDCVITSTSVGGHNFKYREVYSDGSKSAWVSEKLSDANFKFIEEGMKNSNAALAIYNHKNVEGSRVGYLRDFLSTAGQIIYFAYDCPQSTFDSVNATMFGQLNDCVLGIGKTAEGSIVMSCIAGVYNDNIISPAETIYF